MKTHADERGLYFDEKLYPWADLEELNVLTTSDGPFGEDVFFHFYYHDEVLHLPQGRVDQNFVDTFFKYLEGADVSKFGEAMCSTRGRLFRVWYADILERRWDDERFAKRFSALAKRLGRSTEYAQAIFERLKDDWSSPGRFYHNLEHLAECLYELDHAGVDASTADCVELALWYHDSIYDPKGRDLEEQSIERLLKDCDTLKIPESVALRAAKCIRATIHTNSASSSDFAAQLTSDIDLAILGEDPKRFLEYEYSIDDEYKHVPILSYILARGHFLASLLESPAIFKTETVRARYEDKARENITGLLRGPFYRMHRWFGWLYRWVALRK